MDGWGSSVGVGDEVGVEVGSVEVKVDSAGVGIIGGVAGEISEIVIVFLTLDVVFWVVLVVFAGLVVLVVLVAVFLLVIVVGLVVVLRGTGLVVGDFGVDEGVAFLERRVARPSIDLFLSIVYNYNMAGQKITKKQLALLDFLQDFTEENGYSPSYREIQAGLGLSSVSAVAEHIDNLVAKGALRKVPGAARSLEILDYKHEDAVELFKVKMMDAEEEDKKVLIRAAEILGLDLE